MSIQHLMLGELRNFLESAAPLPWDGSHGRDRSFHESNMEAGNLPINTSMEASTLCFTAFSGDSMEAGCKLTLNYMKAMEASTASAEDATTPPKLP